MTTATARKTLHVSGAHDHTNVRYNISVHEFRAGMRGLSGAWTDVTDAYRHLMDVSHRGWGLETARECDSEERDLAAALRAAGHYVSCDAD